MTPIEKQMQKIKGDKLISQMSDKAKREYARLRETLRKKRDGLLIPKKKKAQLWQVHVDKHGTKVFRNQDATLYGVTRAEFNKLGKFKEMRKSKQVTGKKRAAR